MDANAPDKVTDLLLPQYHANLPAYEIICRWVSGKLREILDEAGIIVAAIESRIKTESSLVGKLRLKGNKYHDILDITDIVGLRVITFYIDDVDKVASMVDRLFEIDWENSVDKRKIHEIDSFGYLSLHYICKIPASTFQDPDHPEINQIRFEIQMRTILQHAWANMNHDTGYKSGVEIPKVYLRNLSRLAGMLELVDDEFSRIRTELSDYRRRVRNLVSSGKLDEVPLDGDSFNSYRELAPFEPLNRRIAAINQAEIQEDSLEAYLPIFKAMGFKTLGDIDKLIKEYSEAAFQIACFQLSITDIDIVSSSIGPQDLCTAYILKKGGGRAGIRMMLDALYGPSPGNDAMAGFLLEQSSDLPFMNQ